MGKYFGTDGFRGIVGKTVTADHAYAVGRYLGHACQTDGKRTKILIGKDTRRSSSMLEAALVAGITASGGDCHLLGVTSTPALSDLTRTEGFDLGVMISASHNPFPDNGIKILNREGEKADDSLLSAIETYLDGGGEKIPFATGDAVGAVFPAEGLHPKYLSKLAMIGGRAEGFRVVLDCANGGTSALAKTLFESLGAEPIVLNDTPDGFNINRDCGSTHTASLRRAVSDFHADIGFAFDGDGDRCIAVDENGEERNGDVLLFVLAGAMKEKGKLPGGTVVTTVMSNLGVDLSLRSLGIATEKTAVGDRFVYEKMKEKGYALGGEQSGHIILGEYEHTGDGLLTAVSVLRVLKESGVPFSELCRPVSMLPQKQLSVPVRDRDRVLSHPLVLETLRCFEEKLGKTGRVLLRKSGTEPVLRVMAEAPEQSLCDEVTDTVANAIREAESRIGGVR